MKWFGIASAALLFASLTATGVAAQGQGMPAMRPHVHVRGHVVSVGAHRFSLADGQTVFVMATTKIFPPTHRVRVGDLVDVDGMRADGGNIDARYVALEAPRYR